MILKFRGRRCPPRKRPRSTRPLIRLVFLIFQSAGNTSISLWRSPMTSLHRIFGVILVSASGVTVARSAEPEWAKIHRELLQHFQALVSLDTTNPPGNETQAAEYMKRVLEREGIPVKLLGQEPNRTNLVARLKGNGSKKPLLVMGHTDTVGVQPEKWINPPFSPARKAAYIY